MESDERRNWGGCVECAAHAYQEIWHETGQDGWLPGCLRCSPHRVAGSKFIRDTHCRRGVQWIELPPPGGRPRPATLALAFSAGTVSIWRAPAETCRRGFSRDPRSVARLKLCLPAQTAWLMKLVRRRAGSPPRRTSVGSCRTAAAAVALSEL
ncbi:hypothetical protein MTO96_040482 [Rhipicephalus appendiculatus]